MSAAIPIRPAAIDDSERLLNEHEVSALVSLSAPMLRKLRREGGGPRFVKIGSAVRYSILDVRAWMRSLERQS